MAIHLVKIYHFQHSDMFVRGLDMQKKTINYQIVDKITGQAMEPIKNDPFVFDGDQIVFDKNRTLHKEIVKYIDKTLN